MSLVYKKVTHIQQSRSNQGSSFSQPCIFPQVYVSIYTYTFTFIRRTYHGPASKPVISQTRWKKIIKIAWDWQILQKEMEGHQTLLNFIQAAIDRHKRLRADWLLSLPLSYQKCYFFLSRRFCCIFYSSNHSCQRNKSAMKTKKPVRIKVS